ncbi:hypothetical protein LTR16_002943 [Cryomyces antarcticus]|uniref:Glycosyl hydrolase family 13 catalytic domain-containing protein n=1 Tax=Cryomyces antarcticus TaxID=329879 RepID=A0ABR0KTX7_9PEZI|nr:hypothetical protein LTR16_002943 [Cryomyces antarcticus]
MQSPQTRAWWKEAVVYQIYPASFKDSTGSGFGDLNGITSKLQYLRDLGVDVIWLSPIYESPMRDMGYDISDYRAIHPDMGTMADWERLVEEAHALGMKVIMDLVVNHTSDQHEWFKESKKGGYKRDWYIWQPAKEGKEPNNWGAIFGGSCWEWDEVSKGYYLHVFDVSQPDLNWENPAVREAVWDVMRFWLDKGCDGFRMDVINCVSKEPGFPDAPVTDRKEYYQYGLLHRFNGPYLSRYLKEMNEQVLKYYPDAFTVGETPGIATPEDAIALVRAGKPLQMIFHFEHMYMDIEPDKKCFFHRDWKLTDLKNILGKFMLHMQEHNGWDSLYVENHDQPRILGRWANDTTHRVEAAKMLAIFHATGRGTLFLYQGQELGLANPGHWTYDELRDLEEINFYDAEAAKRPPGADMSDVLAQIQDYRVWNLANELSDPKSPLAFWKELLKIRREHRGLVYGVFEMLDWENEQVYAYTRTDERGQYLVVCSFCAEETAWKCPVASGTLLLANYVVSTYEEGGITRLQAYEGRLYCRTL